jgi:hypothetical protein
MAFVVAGCNFEHYNYASTTSREPACGKSVIRDTPDPVAHWTLNGGDAGSWLQSAQGQVLTNVSGTQDNDTRVNGQGSSLYLDGGQFAQYANDAGDPLFTLNGGFTLSVWISLRQNWLDKIKPQSDAEVVVWPILSTFGSTNECGGYQLDIRVLAGEQTPNLVLSYETPEILDGGSACQVTEIRHPLDAPSWAWGAGKWHHVAGTYQPTTSSNTGLTLYWDGSPVEANSVTSVTSVGQLAAPSPSLYIGARSGALAGRYFSGNLDDIAVFGTPLTQQQVSDFMLKSTTVDGPSNCRWSASEIRDDRVDAGISTATWESHDQDALTADIVDQEWGSGLVAARLAPPGFGKDLSHYSQILLTAQIPDSKTSNGSFEFSLHSGDAVCTWYMNSSDSGKYVIDLNNPGFCQTDPRVCSFAIEHVEWVLISSSWEYPSELKFPAGMQYSIEGLDLIADGNSQDRSRYGGVLGVNSWCWRTQAFQSKNAAKSSWNFEKEPNPQSAISATLSGEPASGSAIVADFGDTTLDLSNCNRVRVCAEFAYAPGSQEPSQDQEFILHIQDNAGAWMEWALNLNPSSGCYEAALDPALKQNSSNVHTLEPYPDNNRSGFSPWQYFPTFDLATSKIALLGIQKPWTWPGTADVTISGVDFLYENQDVGCER